MAAAGVVQMKALLARPYRPGTDMYIQEGRQDARRSPARVAISQCLEFFSLAVVDIGERGKRESLRGFRRVVQWIERYSLRVSIHLFRLQATGTN